MTSDFASSSALILRLILTAGRQVGRTPDAHARVSGRRVVHRARRRGRRGCPTQDPDLKADPIRIIQAIAIGVGFLGGGMITRADGEVAGLTTAASIWSTAAIGIACGLGHVVLAIAVTVLRHLN